MSKVEVKFVRLLEVNNNKHLKNGVYEAGDIIKMDSDVADSFAAAGIVIHLKTDATEIETKDEKPKRTRRKRTPKTETK